MGYTHYWYRTKELPQDEWDAFIKDVEIILIHETQAQELLCGEYNTPPIINKDEVRFNGKNEDGHEAFHFTRVGSDKGFRPHDDGRVVCYDFCKTANKPYDKYVVRVLLLAEKHFYPNSVEVRSDGDWDKIRRETLYEEVQNVEV